MADASFFVRSVIRCAACSAWCIYELVRLRRAVRKATCVDGDHSRLRLCVFVWAIDAKLGQIPRPRRPEHTAECSRKWNLATHAFIFAEIADDHAAHICHAAAVIRELDSRVGLKFIAAASLRATRHQDQQHSELARCRCTVLGADDDFATNPKQRLSGHNCCKLFSHLHLL